MTGGVELLVVLHTSLPERTTLVPEVAHSGFTVVYFVGRTRMQQRTEELCAAAARPRAERQEMEATGLARPCTRSVLPETENKNARALQHLLSTGPAAEGQRCTGCALG